MTLQSQRTPPHNLEAEKAVLGAILIETESLFSVGDFLSPSDFYKHSHRVIYQSILDLFEKNEPIDIVTLSDFLLQKKELENAGTLEYLTTIVGSVPTAANILHHAKIVHEKAVLRRIITSCTSVVTSAYQSDDVASLLDLAEAQIFDISQNRKTSEISSFKDLIMEGFDSIEKMYQNQGEISGTSTGFKDLDLLSSGLKASELIILAARPSMGKTAFATAIMEKAALENKKRVLFFSLEMSKESLVNRMLCSYARVSGHALKKGRLDEKGWLSLTDAASKLSQAHIFIDDTPSMSVLEMKTKGRRIKSKEGLDLVVIDYLQLMKASSRSSEGRHQEIAEISRGLKQLARELDVPVLALSQLSRAVESRQDKTPMLSDLRESGAIEQDADLVLMLMREEYYNPTEENKNKAQVILGKNRNGPTGRVDLVFMKEFTRFESLSHQSGD
ncbi:replicative DNA helicase [PVC group bacterium (ex Bugula neritina AB1)]|nr:replicative DNA helicase [PVC group bacterium (ex Bugula neritina AB1)]